MSKPSRLKWLLAFMLMLLLVLAACSGDSGEEAESSDDTESTEEAAEETEEQEEEGEEESEDNIYSIDDFSPVKTDQGEPMDGGTLNFGLVSDTVFEGVLNPVFYEGNPDAEVMEFFVEGLFSFDENFNYTQDGAATWKLDENDDGTVTMTVEIRDNVNWHDGEPVTAEDLAFAYEVIGHPDYTGVRYYLVENVLGMEEYNAGEADSISGLEIVDEKTLKITFTHAFPGIKASGLWNHPLPKHIFGDIPVEEMAESDAVRKNPIGFGPFKVETITPGEAVTFSAFEDYWQGPPKLDGVTLKVVPPETVAEALESGEIDTVDRFPTDQYPDVKDKLTNVEFLGQQELAYTYIGFKLGKRNDDGEAVMNPDAKMADVNLRRAMWHAVDNDAVGERFYNGLRWKATSLIIPRFTFYHKPDLDVPDYDPDEANRILDEAGYIDVDGDGLREDPNGEKLTINFASMSGGEVAEPIANYYIQAWKQVGLDVQLVDGRLLEFNTFYDRIEADDPEIDIYQGAWGTGTDVDQRGLYSRTASYNYPRYASDKNDELLEAGASPEAMDLEYRKEIYNQWQELMVEEIPVFPTLYRAELIPVNNRVTGWNIQDHWNGLYEVGVTQDDPILP